MKIRKLCLALATATLLFTQQSQAFEVPLTEFTLGNGMHVIVIEDHRSPVVTHSVWYRVGAADDEQGKTGLAHFLEHLMFKGTKKFPEGKFDKILQLNGAQGNAFTAQDFTAYYQRVAVDRLGLMMELEADRMQNLALTDQQVIPERDVVKEERRQRTDNNPSALLSEQIEAALYSAHPYGRPPIGWMTDVEQLTREDALSFYKKHYTPANAILIVAGDVTPEQIKALANQHYGTLKNTFVPKARKRTPEPKSIVERRIKMTSDRATYVSLSKTFLTPSNLANEQDALALEFLAAALGQGSQSKLYRELVLGKKIAVEAGAYSSSHQLDSGRFAVYGIPVEGTSEVALEQAIDAIVADVKKNGIPQSELDRVREQAEAQMAYVLDDQSQLMTAVGSAVMTGVPANKIFDTSAWSKVTPDEIKRVANLYLTPENSVVGLMQPKEK